MVSLPRGVQPGKCRSCGAPIWWVETEKCRDIPLNPTPRPDGNMVIDGGLAVHYDPGDMFHAALARYVSHFVDCPQADRWRRKPR
jgi:hypothetical protein